MTLQRWTKWLNNDVYLGCQICNSATFVSSKFQRWCICYVESRGAVILDTQNTIYLRYQIFKASTSGIVSNWESLWQILQLIANHVYLGYQICNSATFVPANFNGGASAMLKVG
jgi:hypothetical protein